MEKQYIDLLHIILTRSDRRDARYSMFGHMLECDLHKAFPLLSNASLYTAIQELAWFLRGSTDVQELRDRWVHTWDNKHVNSDAGPVNGFFWRHYGEKYVSCTTKYKGRDQIKDIIESIKATPTETITLKGMEEYQLYVSDNKIHCQLVLKYVDVFLELPLHIAKAALLIHLLANETTRQVGTLRIVMGEFYLCEAQAGLAAVHCGKEIPIPPTITINRNPDGLWNLKRDEIILRNHGSKNVKT